MKVSKIILIVLTLVGTVTCLTSCMGPVGDAIAIPFAWLLRVFNSWTGHYALALLLFSLGVKLVLLPLSIRQQKSQIKMARIRPKMLAIEKKYAGRNDQPTLRKKQEELMALQQAEGYSPMSGCLPLLIQLPIILILFEIIREPLTYICLFSSNDILEMWNSVKGLAGDAAATKLSAVNQVELVSLLRENAGVLEEVTGKSLSILPRFDLFGAINLGSTPSLGHFNWLWLIPGINLVLSIVSMRLTKRLGANAAQQMQASTPDQKVSMGIMEWMMPVMTTFFAFQISAAVGVYWIYQSVFGIVQMIVLAKVMPLPKYTKEEMEQMLRDMKVKNAARATGASGRSYADGDRPRSLHHIDDDDEIEAKPAVKKQHQNPPKK
ncbi:MAG: membrane protein insertase YidC [Clostridia bacterium]|nr:membrane protein insertase YidC [Clostridia bacterium]